MAALLLRQPVPFTIHVEQHVLDDLQQRLRQTRTPREENAYFERHFGKDYGQTAKYQHDLLEHWRDAYEWRKFERELNSVPHFTMQMDAHTNLHYIHIHDEDTTKVPLLLIHGWPGSVWEFHDLLPRLRDRFHLVVPSLPGFAWSKTTADDMNVEAMAHLLNDLMLELGYAHYIVQGGDWGSFVAREMAFHHSTSCVAMHSNMPMFIPLPQRGAFLLPDLALDLALPSVRLSAFDRAQLKRGLDYCATGSAYMMLNGTKPHTLGYAITDSPAGLLAYISEKIYLWSDPANNPSSSSSSSVSSHNLHQEKDEVLTNVMIYWATQSITSSLRIYYETLPMTKPAGTLISAVDQIHVPCALAFLPKEIICFPVKWLAHTHVNVVQHTEFLQGGHFAAWEQPALLAEDIHKFVFNALPNTFGASFHQLSSSSSTNQANKLSRTGLTWRDWLSRPAANWWGMLLAIVALAVWKRRKGTAARM